MNYKEKDKVKFSICNQIFGYGSKGSSSYTYNTGNPDWVHADQVIGISVNGNRPNRIPLSEEWVSHFTNLRCAIVTDNTYHRDREYNSGERELANILSNHGYIAYDSEERAIWYHKYDVKEFTEPKKPKSKFRGELYFLSNMYPCVVNVEGESFYCSEAAYQAYKEPHNVAKYTHIDGFTAKRISVKADSNFHKIKLKIMKNILQAKFNNPYLAKLLLNTPTKDLVEENTWGDTYWGVCNGKGQNHLGKLLLEIKSELNQGQNK